MRALKDERISEVLAPVRSVEKLRRQLAREGVEAGTKLKAFEAVAPDWDFASVGEIDYAVHCAGVLFDRRRENYFRINVEGSMRLLGSLQGNPRVAILSSQSAGGPTPVGQTSRSAADPSHPLSWYGESKLALEREIVAVPPAFPILLLRAPMVLGPGDQATLPLFQMVRGRVWPKPGLKTKEFSWIASDDLAAAIEAWLWGTNEGKPFLAQATSRGTISDRDLIETAAKVSGRRGLLLPVPQTLLRLVAAASHVIPAIGNNVPSLMPDRAREIWPSRWVLDSTAFEEATGWKPQAELEGTLRRTLEWYVREGRVEGEILKG